MRHENRLLCFSRIKASWTLDIPRTTTADLAVRVAERSIVACDPTHAEYYILRDEPNRVACQRAAPSSLGADPKSGVEPTDSIANIPGSGLGACEMRDDEWLQNDCRIGKELVI